MINTNGSGDAYAKYQSSGNIAIGTNNKDQIIVGKDSNVQIINNLTLSKSPSAGIKIDTNTPTYGWRDIIGDITPDDAGAGSAVLDIWRGGSYRAYFYAANDRIDMIYHIPHDYVAGTDLFLHLHWGHHGTAISGQLVVTMGMTYAKGHNQANFPAEKAPVLTVSTPDIATVPQYRHRIDEIQISTTGGSATLINTADLEPDGLILTSAIVTTIPTITGGAERDLPAFFTLDVHYQSTNIGTKQRTPDFYT